MATTKKKASYTEPKRYFNADMLKAAKDWDKAHPEKKAAAPKKPAAAKKAVPAKKPAAKKTK